MKDNPEAVIQPLDAEPHVFLRDLTFPDNLSTAGPRLYLHEDPATCVAP